MPNPVDKLAERRIALKNQLTRIYGSKQVEVITQVLERHPDLLYNENPFKEAERLVKAQLKEPGPRKSKLLVKPHIAKRIQDLQKRMDYTNNPLTKSTQAEPEAKDHFNPFKVESERVIGPPMIKTFNTKQQSPWKLVTEKHDGHHRKRNTDIGIPSSLAKDPEQSVRGPQCAPKGEPRDNPIKAFNKVQRPKASLPYNNTLEVDTNDHCARTDKHQPFNESPEALKQTGPAKHTKPKSMLKVPRDGSTLKSGNKGLLGKLDKLYNDTVNSHIDDEILKGIDTSSLGDSPIKRGKSVGNFITGRGTKDLKRLELRTSFEFSQDEAIEGDINLELDEIREIASKEGSFISQDLFKQKKPAKKEAKPGPKGKPADTKTKPAPPATKPKPKPKKQVIATPSKPKASEKVRRPNTEQSTPHKPTTTRPTNFIKKTETKAEKPKHPQEIRRGMKRVSEVEGLVTDFTAQSTEHNHLREEPVKR